MQILRSDVSCKCHSRKAHGCSRAVHHELECCFYSFTLLYSKLSEGKNRRSLLWRRNRRGVSALPFCIPTPSASAHVYVHTLHTDANCTLTDNLSLMTGNCRACQPGVACLCGISTQSGLYKTLIPHMIQIWATSNADCLPALAECMDRITGRCILAHYECFLLRKCNTGETDKLTKFPMLRC